MTADQWQWLALVVLAGFGAYLYLCVSCAFDAGHDALRALRIRGLVCLQCDQPVLGEGERFCGEACAEARDEARKRMYR